jgi:hypothetical protein
MRFQIYRPEDWAGVTFDADEISIEVGAAPVSLQARSESRLRVIEEVRKLTRPCDFVFTNDVTVEVEWRVAEELRYESDASADVDNIIKPLMDAISGPHGLLINDCQVQAVTSYWVGAEAGHQSLAIRVRALMEDFKTGKSSLFFVQFGSGLCFPLDGSLPKEAVAVMGWAYRQALLRREELKRIWGDSRYSRYLNPSQRMYHRTGVGDFPVMTFEEFERQYGPMPTTRTEGDAEGGE